MSVDTAVPPDAVGAAAAAYNVHLETHGDGIRRVELAPLLVAILEAAAPHMVIGIEVIREVPIEVVVASKSAAAALHEAAAHLRRLDGQISALGTDRKVTADWLDELAGRRG